MRDDRPFPPKPTHAAQESWPRVKEILADALELEGAERERFLATTCGNDAALRSQVDALLDAHDQSGPIDRLADELVSPLLERASSDLAAELEPPAQVGHYRVIEPIGTGGMGVVYSAHDRRLDRRVALKFLRPHLVADEAATARFLQEARSAAALDHPNICTIYEIGQSSDGKFFIAMPLYEGETLERRIARGPLPVAEAANLALQAAHGLARTHERGIIHRDLKPSNLFVTDDDIVKVLDFGIAKLAGAAHPATGARAGTIAYMSPEQAHGNEVDRRTDIWSLGAVLYEMLTGRRAFAVNDQADILDKILNQSVAPPHTLRPDIPADLSAAVMRMLAREAAARPASMHDVAAVLAPHSSKRRTPAFRKLAIASALVVVVLAGGLALLKSRGSAVTGDPNVLAVFPFTVVGDRDVEYLREGMVSLLSKQLDGAGSLRTVDSRAVLATTRAANPRRIDPHSASEIAARLGAGTFVLGDIAGAGDRVRLHATLFEGGSPRGEAEAEGAGSDLFRLVDEVAAELLVAARGGTGGRPSRIAALTTASLPALKAFLNGEAAYRAERYADAIEWYDNAVALDSAFALGHFRLALAAQQLTLGSKAGPALSRALQHADRLSARDRKLIDVLRTWYRGEHAAAADQFRTLLGAYPDEVEAWNALGILLLMTNPMHGRSVSEAREPFERAVAYDPGSPFPVRHLVYVAAAEGRLRAVDSLVARLDSLGGRGDRWFEMEGIRVSARRDPHAYQLFLAALDTAQDMQVLMGTDAPVIFLRDFDGATGSARLLTPPARSIEARSVAHSWLARLYAARGRWREALREIDALRRIDDNTALDTYAELVSMPYAPVTSAQRDSLRRALDAAIKQQATTPPPANAPTSDAHWYYAPLARARPAIRTYLGGMLALQSGDAIGAQRAAARLSARRSPLLTDNLARTLRAALLVREGKHDQALRELEAFDDPPVVVAVGAPLGSHPAARLMRAELLERLGRYEEALPWCTTLGYVSIYEVTYVPAANQCAHRILTRLGRAREAERYRSELLRMWSQADAELASFVRN